MSYPQETFAHTTLHQGSLLYNRREAVRANTLLYQLDVLKQTGRYDAFHLQWHPSYDDKPDVWPIPNHLFWDSDIAKWIEGACYFLYDGHHPEIEIAIHELVDMIRSAQQPDGYLNVHFTVVEPEKRFSNLRDLHELYNAGHLIEAALAHNSYYRNDLLLDPILKYVTLLCNKFGPGESQVHGYPGHPEIELALLRLYEKTGRKEILDLADYFVSERGNPSGVNGKHYYVAEAESRQDDPDKRPAYWPTFDCLWYYQAHKPIVEQETIEGHSVRAMYLLTAAADLVRIHNDSSHSQLLSAIYRLWNNMVEKKMYITGGIGAMKQWEGFGLDYFLPQGTDEGGCYSETCAAIGVMMLAQRLLQIQLDGKIADVMETCLYNAVLTAMSYDGKKFTYVNQLASSEEDLSKREDWFTCACCPPNVLRLLGQIGGYINSFDVNTTDNISTINVHLFVSNTLEFKTGSDIIKFSQHSDWPWHGKIDCEVHANNAKVEMNIRIPQWADKFAITPECPEALLKNGYLHLPSKYLQANPSFVIDIPLQPRLISPHPYTNQNTLALARGPLIYCVEDYDNPWVQDHFKSVRLNPQCRFFEIHRDDGVTNTSFIEIVTNQGAYIPSTDGIKGNPGIESKQLAEVNSKARCVDQLVFVPYYMRANRGGRGQMRVGLKRCEGQRGGMCV